MLRVAIKGLLARKLRLLLTSIAVVLGVGFVSGAYFLTDSMRDSFTNIFTEASRGVDVHVQTKEYKELAEKQATSAPGTISIDLARVGVSPDVIEDIDELPNVELVTGSIFEVGATVLDKKGKPITANAPTFGANWDEKAAKVGALRLAKGDAPKRGEVLLDGSVMKDGKFEIGDKVRIQTQSGRNTDEFTVSGVVKFGSQDNLNGATITVFETAQAQELFDMGDRFTAVDAKAKSGTSQVALKRDVQRVLGDEYEVVTGKEFTAEQTESIDEGFLKIFQNIILGFAGVAVFVGAFTIFNTFTILVSQRTREIGLLRAIGTSRSQIVWSVVLEALITGIIASTLGILAGYGIALGLRELISAVGAEFPASGFPLKARTIIASYSVGVLVTLVACIIPAIRASRLSPLEALRSNSAHAGHGWKAPSFGAALAVLGGFIVSSGFTGSDLGVSDILIRVAGGFALAIIGIAFLSRWVILPFTRIIGPLFAWGTAGKLAIGNVLRNRARSAVTASALMIGLAVATLALVFQASLTNTVDAEIDRTLGADISIYNSSVMSSGAGYVDKDDLEEIADIDGVDDVGSQFYGGASIGTTFDTENTKIITAFDEDTFGKDGAVRVKMLEGEENVGDGVLVDDGFAKEEKLKVGDDLTLSFTTKKTESYEVRGIFETNQFVGSPIVLSLDAFNDTQAPAVQATAWAYVTVEDGEKSSKVANRIEKELGRDGAYLEVQDTEEFRQMFRDQLAPILGIVFGLLSLSLIIALFGIANTLALNVFERTREIGLLRAVGATQRQMKRMIRAEAVIVALFGALVGMLIGLLAGYALITALEDEGFEFAVNIGTLVLILLLGFLAGLVAAIFPARRAAKLNVLDAIATE